jgi:hypothetical protein
MDTGGSDEENMVEQPKKSELKAPAPLTPSKSFVAVRTSPTKKRKVAPSTVDESASVAGSEAKQMSMIILRLGEVAKALGVMNGHLSVLARSLSGDRSRSKAAAAVAASYARAKLENERAGDASEPDDDDGSDNSGGDDDEAKGKGPARVAGKPGLLAEEVALNTKEKQDKKANKENAKPKAEAAATAEPKSGKKAKKGSSN